MTRPGNPPLAYRIASGGKTRTKALRHILHSLEQHSWNVTHTAKALGVTPRTLFRWQQRFPVIAQARQNREYGAALQSVRSSDTRVIVVEVDDG